jgi:hypothetical protein
MPYIPHENVVRRFNAKVGRHDVFTPATWNEEFHGISNDSGVGIVNFSMSKNVIIKEYNILTSLHL